MATLFFPHRHAHVLFDTQSVIIPFIFLRVCLLPGLWCPWGQRPCPLLIPRLCGAHRHLFLNEMHLEMGTFPSRTELRINIYVPRQQSWKSKTNKRSRHIEKKVLKQNFSRKCYNSPRGSPVLVQIFNWTCIGTQPAACLGSSQVGLRGRTNSGKPH